MAIRILTTQVSTELAEKVDAIASRLDRSREWVMNQALTDWIGQEEEHHRMTLEGLADVDAGRLVDADRVIAWIQSLGTESPLPPPA